jgi:hypothetical protein
MGFANNAVLSSHCAAVHTSVAARITIKIP